MCDGVFEKIAETRSEAVDAIIRLAQRSGANTGHTLFISESF